MRNLCCGSYWAAIAIALIVLVARHDEGMVGPLSTDDFASLSYQIVLLVFLASVVVVMFRERFTQAITAALLWIAIGLVLLVGYTYRFELREVADRVLAELVPGHVVAHGRIGGSGARLQRRLSISRRRSMARASRWCSIPAQVPSC